jgi:hypothetical protein
LAQRRRFHVLCRERRVTRRGTDRVVLVHG